MRYPRSIAECAVAASLFLSCTHVVGFHPVKLAPEADAKTEASVRFYLAPEIKSASHSFRAAGSGMANTWVVDYGVRVHEFALIYLAAAFTDFREVPAPAAAVGSEVLLTIKSVEYVVKNQAAHISLDATAIDASGQPILSKHYSTRGWSGGGVVLAGGVFAQEGVTRSSTDQALKEIFLTLIEDLRLALDR